jgi:four helix bundle protein
MAFHALELSYDVITALAAPLARIAAADASLADQLRRAAQSVSLNLTEGSGRAGRDRARCYRIAQGSHLEARSCLRVAERFGYLAADEYAVVDRLADRLAGMLWSLAR